MRSSVLPAAMRTMWLEADELAGLCDVFGGVTAAELRAAVEELAFRAGIDPPTDETFEAALAAALSSYHLVETDHQDGTLIAAGPAAFPLTPDGAEDIPHILEIPDRTIDRDPIARRIRDDLQDDATDGSINDSEELLQLAYDLEAWSSVSTGELRDTIDAATNDDRRQT